MKIRNSLFVTTGVWLALNFLILLGIGGAFMLFLLFGNSDGLFSDHWFSANADSRLRVISTNLQFRPQSEWENILQEYDTPEYRHHLVNLDAPFYYYTPDFIPHEVLDAARRIPKTNFTLCSTPEQAFRDTPQHILDSVIADMETGLPPTPPVLFMRSGSPASYWYGRALFVPDDQHMLHFVFLAVQSSSFTGNGLFFNIQHIVFVLFAAIVISGLWWIPLIWYMVKPLLGMVRYAESVASQSGGQPVECCPETGGRTDEIGRLNRALVTMTNKLTRQMAGQRLFIRHIAHELNTPLWRCRLGMDVLEERLEGELKLRVQKSIAELDNLSQLTEDILSFLRDQSREAPGQSEAVELMPLLQEQRRKHGTVETDIRLQGGEGITVWGHAECLRRALHNLLKNAVTYAGKDGPIDVIVAAEDEGRCTITVRDHGPGVAEASLDSLFEPFFRCAETQLYHPGGSGLGLAIVKNCVEQCGGTAACRNAEPRGFEVTLTLSRVLK